MLRIAGNDRQHGSLQAEQAHATLLSQNIISPGHPDIQNAARRVSTSVGKLGEAKINLITAATFIESQTTAVIQVKGELETDGAALSEYSEGIGRFRQASASLGNQARPQL